MSDNWEIGDLALCVDDTNLKKGLVRKGAIYRVIDLLTGDHVRFGPQVSLFFDGVDDMMGHAAIRFRKIHPLSATDHRAFIVELAADQKVGA